MGKPTGFLEYERENPATAPVEERIESYAEFVAPLDATQSHAQTARCMDCGVPFCHSGCPLGNKIPDFNDAVYRGQWKEAHAILKSTNNFPEFTGRICPAPCEGACVLGINNDPVSIEQIERTIADRAFEEGWEVPRIPPYRTNKRIAVIGSGPAGLAAADELNQQGHFVTVFEKDDEVGGLLRYGIPDFKLDKDVVRRRVDLLKAEGITFTLNTEVGKDVSASELLASNDALILAGGSTVPRDLTIPGRELDGVHFAMDFLTYQNRAVKGMSNEGEPILAKDKNVVVIGGGDTGSDCVGTSNRQGAKSVTQIEILDKPPAKRIADNPWPEWPMVLRTSSSHEEGAQRKWALLTKKFTGEKGKLTGLQVVTVNFVDGQMKAVPESEHIIPCDLALIAAGFLHPQKEGLLNQLGVDLNNRGNVKTEGFRTSQKKIFAAGDMRRGQSLVVWAIAEGRRAAEEVNEFLGQERMDSSGGSS